MEKRVVLGGGVAVWVLNKSPECHTQSFLKAAGPQVALVQFLLSPKPDRMRNGFPA